MATAVETTKNFMNVLRNYSQDASTPIGRIALDQAVRQVTLYNSLEDVIDKLQTTLKDTETYPDTDTRLQKATGMVIGAEDDYSVDTGAITGSNAGGSTVKNAQDIVPEDNVDLSTLPMPEAGSTTPITYTGNDGNTFTFYVKWPDSFTTVVDGSREGTDDQLIRIKDSRYHVDLNTLDENGYYELPPSSDTNLPALNDNTTSTQKSPTYGQMKNAITTAVKGLYNYWLREGAKLNYDSLGLALNGQTIEIAFVAGGEYDKMAAITFNNRNDDLPTNHIYIAVALCRYGVLDPTDPNGNTSYNGHEARTYLDRVIAHEMVHAVMFATGTFKSNMPQFFTEGIADLVQGDDDYNSEQRNLMIELVNDPDTLKKGLVLLEGTGDSYAYPAGDMLMRFIAQQSLDVTSIVGDASQAQTYSYNTPNAVITNYKPSETVNYPHYIADAWTTGNTLNDLVIKEKVDNADENLLILRDVRDKLVTLNTPTGNAYAYLTSNSKEINGNNFEGGQRFEILYGANYQNDIVRAGNGGSQLWGGLQGNDDLFGGSGIDTFNYYTDDGHDSFQNAESQDIIFLRNMTLDNISGAMFTDYGSYFRFTDGGSLVINGQPSTFLVEDEKSQITTYRADYQNKQWTQE